MATPSVEHRAYAVPRAGGEAGDYEDAAAIEAKEWPVSAAVADGATESVFARTWAKRLVRGLVQNKTTTAAAFLEAVPDWQSEWQSDVSERVGERPWYVTAKAAEGAFAAVLGLSLSADGQWCAVSVGDCCLFQMREGALLESWPLEAADAFTNRPALVPSRPNQEVPSPDASTGVWHPGDRFLLATDAVAAWLMDGDPEGVSRLDPDAFQARVAAARTDGSLRNDDATLLVLELTPPPEIDEDASGGS